MTHSYDPLNGKPEDLEHRSASNAALHRLRYTPWAIKEAIAERNYDAAMAGLAHCINEREPWAIMAWLKVVDAISPDIKIYLLERWGVANEAEARGLIESGRKLEGLGDMSVLAQLEAALEVVKMCLGREPQHAKMVAKALESYAEVEE
jgi:hypothetical protein